MLESGVQPCLSSPSPLSKRWNNAAPWQGLRSLFDVSVWQVGWSVGGWLGGWLDPWLLFGSRGLRSGWLIFLVGLGWFVGLVVLDSFGGFWVGWLAKFWHLGSAWMGLVLVWVDLVCCVLFFGSCPFASLFVGLFCFLFALFCFVIFCFILLCLVLVCFDAFWLFLVRFGLFWFGCFGLFLFVCLVSFWLVFLFGSVLFVCSSGWLVVWLVCQFVGLQFCVVVPCRFLRRWLRQANRRPNRERGQVGTMCR